MPEPKQLPSGKWRIRLYIGKDKNGKKVYVSFTADKKSEVKYKAKEFYLHTKTSEQPLTMTLGEAIDMYISSKSNILSPSTIRGYKVIRKRCFQNLMGVSLRNITQDKIQRAVNIEALSYSPKYIKNAHGLISAVLATYYPELILRTTLPKKRKKEGYIPSKHKIPKHTKTQQSTTFYIFAVCDI